VVHDTVGGGGPAAVGGSDFFAQVGAGLHDITGIGSRILRPGDFLPEQPNPKP
jgi:hypothetical protein